MLAIPYYKRTLLNLLPLPLQLIFSQWIPLEIQHAPPRCFQTQALVTSKATTSLKMPQHFMVPMGEHGHILPAQPTIKVAWHIGSIRCPCDVEPPKLCCRVYLLQPVSFLGQNFPAPLASICLVSASVRRINSLRTLEGPCFIRSSTSFNSANRKWTSYTKYETTEPKRRKILTIHQRRQQLSLHLLANGSTQGHHSDDQWHESQWQRDRSRTDLQTNKNGKNWEPTWNITSKFLI